jgi:1,4-alpha-glucan branching enzyme
MQKSSDGWTLPVFIKEGSFTYKYIVDKKWMTDPGNPQLRDDGFGNTNSLLTKGEAYLFTLKGYRNAREVIVAGQFNNWNPDELKMQKTENGWELPYVLASGNYQYKFIVDGNWMRDPANPLSAEMGGEQNSLIAINPTHTFTLKNVFVDAREIKIAGNFNGWNGYSMSKTGAEWVISLHISPGKCLYKFVVDGQWIIDPNNSQWEENEFGEGNSVLWVRNQQ